MWSLRASIVLDFRKIRVTSTLDYGFVRVRYLGASTGFHKKKGDEYSKKPKKPCARVRTGFVPLETIIRLVCIIVGKRIKKFSSRSLYLVEQVVSPRGSSALVS